MRSFAWIATGLALGLTATHVLAMSPKVTLELKQVRAREAVLEIGKASGLEIKFQDSLGQDFPTPAQQLRKADFHWNQAPLAHALRDVCSVYGLRLYPNKAGYLLYFSSKDEPDPTPLATSEAHGNRLSLRQVIVESVRRVGTSEESFRGPGRMQLVLEGRVAEGDAGVMAGLTKITAKDDRGNVLVQDFGLVFTPQGRNLFPDEWRAGIAMTAPDPSARKLEWLEGDLMRAEVYEPFRIEASLPPEAPREAVDGISAEVREFFPTPELAGGPGSPSGPRIVYRLKSPSRTYLYTRSRELRVAPVLVGKSGQIYRTFQEFGGFVSSKEPLVLMSEYTATLPAIHEPIKSVVFEGFKKSGSVKIGHFRMENIPLPTETPTSPRRVAATQSSVPVEKRPYYDANGGVLRSEVSIDGKAAQQGVLAFGLSRVGEGDGVEWYEASVDNIGVARITALKPGEYRLFRIFHPKEAAGSLGEGEWKNSEVRVRLRAGREIEAEPLRWEKKRRKRD